MLGPRNIYAIHKMDDDISRADVLVAGLGLNVVHYVVSFVDSANEILFCMYINWVTFHRKYEKNNLKICYFLPEPKVRHLLSLLGWRCSLDGMLDALQCPLHHTILLIEKLFQYH